MTKCQHCDADILSTSQPTASELAPCPFCGASDAFAEREDFTSAYVTCNHCSARGPVECQESDDEETPGKSSAEISWNTRLSRTSQPNRMGTTPEMQKMYDEFGGEPVAWRYQRKIGWGDIWRCSTVPVNFETPEHWTVEPLYAAALAATPAVGGWSLTREDMEKLHGQAHGGAMLGGDNAYQACLAIEGILARIAERAALAQPASPLRGRLVEQLTEWFDCLDFDRSHEATRQAEYSELMRIVSASPPEQPASFAERNLIDRFGRHLKEQPAADQVTSTKEDYHD